MRFLLIASLFVSSTAFACPNLAGKYASCRSTTGQTSGSSDVVITQGITNRITTFVVTMTDENQDRSTHTYKADGKVTKEEIKDPDSDLVIQTLSTASCTNTAFTVKSEVKYGGEIAITLATKMYKNGKQLIIENSGYDGETNYSEKQICE